MNAFICASMNVCMQVYWQHLFDEITRSVIMYAYIHGIDYMYECVYACMYIQRLRSTNVSAL